MTGTEPAIDEVPERFSAVLLWRLRLLSLGMQAVIWSTIGLGFGALARPALGGGRSLRRPELGGAGSRGASRSSRHRPRNRLLSQ